MHRTHRTAHRQAKLSTRHWVRFVTIRARDFLRSGFTADTQAPCPPRPPHFLITLLRRGSLELRQIHIWMSLGGTPVSSGSLLVCVLCFRTENLTVSWLYPPALFLVARLQLRLRPEWAGAVRRWPHLGWDGHQSVDAEYVCRCDAPVHARLLVLHNTPLQVACPLPCNHQPTPVSYRCGCRSGRRR